MDESVFFYESFTDTVSSITPYHERHCDVGSLAEAHPEMIYFYATLIPS